MTIGVILGVVAIFLLINALYVGAEFALVGAPKEAIEHRAGEGDRRLDLGGIKPRGRSARSARGHDWPHRALTRSGETRQASPP